jgi:hypothetical protein
MTLCLTAVPIETRFMFCIRESIRRDVTIPGAGFWIKVEIFGLLLIPFGVVAVAAAFDVFFRLLREPRRIERITAVTSKRLRWRVRPRPSAEAAGPRA